MSFLNFYKMKQPRIIAWLKPECGWSMGVRAIMRKYNLKYEDRDMINNMANYQEMVEKSGQSLSPCVEINNKMLADVSGDEVEDYLVEKGYIKRKEDPTDIPTNQACQGH